MLELDEHYEVVRRAVAEQGRDWDEWPDVVVTAPLDNQVRLSALLLLLTTTDPGVEIDGGVVAVHDPAVDVMDRLRRRRLPWDAKTARLAVAVVMQGRFNDYRVEVALRGSEVVCAAGEADAALLRALQDCVAWLGTLDSLGAAEMLRLAQRAISAATPPDLLDLSMLQPGDAWVDSARAVARTQPADDVAPLVRTLGRLGAGKPSQAWWRAVEDALRPAAARELAKSWLELAADTDVVQLEADGARLLFAYGNDDVVRALVYAAGLLPGEPWAPGVLGVLARRGAAPCGVPGIPASLSLKVASAAVDSLIARGTPADRGVLEQLLEDLSRRDLVKRIGTALGRGAEVADRDAALRRTKAAAVRRKADPAPRRDRAAADKLIRRHLAPTLRRTGFTGRDRRWLRVQPDRVDAIRIGFSEQQIDVSYGTRFDAAHPEGDPYPTERTDAARSGYLDVLLNETWKATEPAMERCAHHLETVVVPFLDTLGRYELARAYLELDAGRPSSAHRMEEPGEVTTSATLGLLALAAGDRGTALTHLNRRLAQAETWANNVEPTRRSAADTEVRFWRAQVDLARLLG